VNDTGYLLCLDDGTLSTSTNCESSDDENQVSIGTGAFIFFLFFYGIFYSYAV
jgi:hypothetical protein